MSNFFSDKSFFIKSRRISSLITLVNFDGNSILIFAGVDCSRGLKFIGIVDSGNSFCGLSSVGFKALEFSSRVVFA